MTTQILHVRCFELWFSLLAFSARKYLFASVTSIVVILYIHLSIMGPAETVYAFTDMTVIRCDG